MFVFLFIYIYIYTGVCILSLLTFRSEHFLLCDCRGLETGFSNSPTPSPWCSLFLAGVPWGSVAVAMTYFPHHEAPGIPELRSDSARG